MKKIIFEQDTLFNKRFIVHTNTEMPQALIAHLKRVSGVDSLYNYNGMKYQTVLNIGLAFDQNKVLSEFATAYHRY